MRRRYKVLGSVAGLVVFLGVVEVSRASATSGTAEFPSPGIITSPTSNPAAPFAQLAAQLPSVAVLDTSIQTETPSVTLNGNMVDLNSLGVVVHNLELRAAQNKLVAQVGPTGRNSKVSSAQIATIALGVAADYHTFLAQGVAYLVFEQLTFNYAVAHGTEVSLATATTGAEADWRNWQTMGANGISTTSYTRADFLGTGAIAAERRLLTIAKEELAIAGAQSSTQGLDRTPLFAAWLTSQLDSTSVKIENVAGLTTSGLARELPTDM